MGWDGMGWDGMGWDGMGWDGMVGLWNWEWRHGSLLFLGMAWGFNENFCRLRDEGMKTSVARNFVRSFGSRLEAWQSWFC